MMDLREPNCKMFTPMTAFIVSEHGGVKRCVFLFCLYVCLMIYMQVFCMHVFVLFIVFVNPHLYILFMYQDEFLCVIYIAGPCW